MIYLIFFEAFFYWNRLVIIFYYTLVHRLCRHQRAKSVVDDRRDWQPRCVLLRGMCELNE